ncbi:MAG: hypothetical protein ACJ78Q_01450 [Chloroflexia bacterium]
MNRRQALVALAGVATWAALPWAIRPPKDWSHWTYWITYSDFAGARHTEVVEFLGSRSKVESSLRQKAEVWARWSRRPVWYRLANETPLTTVFPPPERAMVTGG